LTPQKTARAPLKNSKGNFMLSRRSFLARTSMLGLAAAPLSRAWPALLSPTPTSIGDIDAITGDGKHVTLSRASVQELASSIRGQRDPARRSRI